MAQPPTEHDLDWLKTAFAGGGWLVGIGAILKSFFTRKRDHEEHEEHLVEVLMKKVEMSEQDMRDRIGRLENSLRETEDNNRLLREQINQLGLVRVRLETQNEQLILQNNNLMAQNTDLHKQLQIMREEADREP